MDKLEKLIARAKQIHSTGLIMCMVDGSRRRIDAGEAIRAIMDSMEGVSGFEDPEPDTQTNGQLTNLLNGLLEA